MLLAFAVAALPVACLSYGTKETIVVNLKKFGYKDCGICLGVPSYFCNNPVYDACLPKGPFKNMTYGILPTRPSAPGSPVMNTFCPIGTVHCGRCNCQASVSCDAESIDFEAHCAGMAYFPTDSESPWPESTKQPQHFTCGSCKNVLPGVNDSMCTDGTCSGVMSTLPVRNTDDPTCPPSQVNCGNCTCVTSSFCNTPLCSQVKPSTPKLQTNFPARLTVVQAVLAKGYLDCGICIGVPKEFCDYTNPANTLWYACVPYSGESYLYGIRRPANDPTCESSNVDCGACQCASEAMCAGNTFGSPCGGAAYGARVDPQDVRRHVSVYGSCWGDDIQVSQCRGIVNFGENRTKDPDCPANYADCYDLDGTLHQCVPQNICIFFQFGATTIRNARLGGRTRLSKDGVREKNYSQQP